jgi:ketosteroid isomerase-like protein
MTMTTRESFERGTSTFNAHDLDGFAEVMAEDVVFTAPGGIGGQGKAACVAFFSGWYSAFSDAHVEVNRVHFIDDIVIEEGTFSGTHDGVLHTPSGDLAPTGRAVSVPYIHTLRYREGLHASFDLMFDRLLMLEQLGLVPAPAATQ